MNVDLAQSLGEKFCKEHFPGHQAIVCTHPDGHNGSGNVHVHIVINSLRIEEVPFMPYMDRPCDTQPGMKHRCTNAAMEYFRAEVMEMCHDAGLYQIDLLNGSKNRVTERLTVRNYCAMALPQITVTLRSGRTLYRFNGSYDGNRSLPAKLLDRMVRDNEN